MNMEEIREAAQRVVSYNWDSEVADFRECPSEGHIFTDLVLLQGWLGEGDVDAAAVDGADDTPDMPKLRKTLSTPFQWEEDEPPFSAVHFRFHTPAGPNPPCANCKHLNWQQEAATPTPITLHGITATDILRLADLIDAFPSAGMQDLEAELRVNYLRLCGYGYKEGN